MIYMYMYIQRSITLIQKESKHKDEEMGKAHKLESDSDIIRKKKTIVIPCLIPQGI